MVALYVFKRGTVDYPASEDKRRKRGPFQVLKPFSNFLARKLSVLMINAIFMFSAYMIWFVPIEIRLM